ncbi:MAG: DUF4258 domain-containing protein [Clostridiales bacterium]|nr:DUF4258 domain-containing protein [Clostridiales bacterium]
MKIKFSRHARRQMKWRKIEENEVKEAISNPEKLEDTIKGRKNAFKMVEDRLLKVTYISEGRDEITVITAIIKGE